MTGTVVRRAGRTPVIYVDLSVIYQRDAQTGIQRVVRAIWTQLQQSPPPGFIVQGLAGSRWRSYRLVPDDFMATTTRPLLARLPRVRQVGEGDVFLALDLAAHVVPYRARQIRSWRRAGCRISAIVYDLLPARCPEWFDGTLVRRFRKWLKWLLKDVDIALCISRTVADQLTEFAIARAGGKPLAIDSITLGSDITASAPSTGIKTQHQKLLSSLQDLPFLLCVGTIEPRKAHTVLLPAFHFAQSLNDQFRLIVVGRAGWKTEALQSEMAALSNQTDRFCWVSDASDEFLTELYKNCAAVIVPSFDEGFGLPVAEALAFGKSVLARNIPVFREFVDSRITLFDNDAEEALGRRLLLALSPVPDRPPAPSGSTLTWHYCTQQMIKKIT